MHKTFQHQWLCIVKVERSAGLCLGECHHCDGPGGSSCVIIRVSITSPGEGCKQRANEMSTSIIIYLGTYRALSLERKWCSFLN